MQCACPNCGILMAWESKGMDSACVCPECFYKCAACMGTNQVLTPDQLALHAQKIAAERESQRDEDD